MKKALILGASGLIGTHLEARLKADGYFVVSAARHRSPYKDAIGVDEFNHVDLMIPDNPILKSIFSRHDYDEVYQLAAEVGGVGYIATGTNDAVIMANSVQININVLKQIEAMAARRPPPKVFFASSQCVYPFVFVLNDDGVTLDLDVRMKESDASFGTFPFAQEKMFSEQLYMSFGRDCGFPVAIARFGNTYGPFMTWNGQRAKAPGALMRKVARIWPGQDIEVFGDGKQTRSFTYVDDAVEGIRRLMASSYEMPVNIASSELVTIDKFVEMVCDAAAKPAYIKHISGPTGVRGRNSDNTLCREVLGWEPSISLAEGIAKTYPWVKEQVDLTAVSH